MNLDELAEEVASVPPPQEEECDPCSRPLGKVLPFDTSKVTIRFPERLMRHEEEKIYTDNDHYYHLVIVTDEHTGTATYQKMFADGHLGSVTDDG